MAEAGWGRGKWLFVLVFVQRQDLLEGRGEEDHPLALIGRLQAGSKRHVSSSARADLDIDPAAAAEKFAEGYDVIICGHVHRAGVMPVTAEGSQKALITLGAWERRIEYLVYDGADFRSQSLEDPDSA